MKNELDYTKTQENIMYYFNKLVNNEEVHTKIRLKTIELGKWLLDINLISKTSNILPTKNIVNKIICLATPLSTLEEDFIVSSVNTNYNIDSMMANGNYRDCDVQVEVVKVKKIEIGE